MQPSATLFEASGTTSDSENAIVRPKPRQRSQAPAGELKEKRFGVGSWKSSSQSGHRSRLLNFSSAASAPSSAIRMTDSSPLPFSKAASRDSAMRARFVSAKATRSCATRNRPSGSSTMRRYPCFSSRASVSSREKLDGMATRKTISAREPAKPAVCSLPKTLSGVSTVIALPQPGQKRRARLAKSSLRWSLSSVIVPTVERDVRTGLIWRMAMAGGMPSTESTSGGSMRSRNMRA